MDWNNIFSRARRGVREDFRLYVVAVSSLAVAFLCLSVTLLFAVNVDAMTARLGDSGKLTVYLRDGASESDVGNLQSALQGLAGVSGVVRVTASDARREFLGQGDSFRDLEALPVDAFPASFDVSFRDGTTAAEVTAISTRVQRFAVVDDVETYKSWYGQLERFAGTVRGAALSLLVLVAICALAVIGNTIRLAVAGRRAEVEVMKLCGATDGFIRTPFLIEGVVQGLLGAVLGVGVLAIGYLAVRSELASFGQVVLGAEPSFLGPLALVGLVGLGMFCGALGSVVSLRRYLAI